MPGFSARLAPGRYYNGTTLNVTVNFADADGVAVDPDTVTIKTMSPCGSQASYAYGTDAELTKLTTGSYNAELVPNEGGRWFFRWISTGTGTATVLEGDFLIQASPFEDAIERAYALP